MWEMNRFAVVTSAGKVFYTAYTIWDAWKSQLALQRLAYEEMNYHIITDLYSKDIAINSPNFYLFHGPEMLCKS